MSWTQVTDPLDNMVFSALAAAIPVLFIFWALIIKKMKGYLASLLTLVAAIIFAVAVYRMPLTLAVLSGFNGILYGLFPICWIIIGALFIYNVAVASGQFEIIKGSIASITSDRRIQAVLIAFSFGAFLEGAAGMGTPVAITAAMLAGLGFNPLYAAGLCLIANTAPVAFGAIGIPITTAAQVSGIPEMAISMMVGRTLPFLSVMVPFYLIILMCGFKKSLEVLPAILVSGISFAFFQWLVSNYVGPMLPDIIAGLASIICLIILLRFWKPSSEWHFKDQPEPSVENIPAFSKAQILKAWSPFIVMTVMIIAWGLQPVKDLLNSAGQIKFDIPGLKNAIMTAGGSPLTIRPFDFNYLSAAGTALLLSGVISVPLTGLKPAQGFRLFFSTLYQLRYTILTIASVLGFAFVTNYSGMSITIALALSATGVLFPFFAPVLGWLGVFLTGSDTSSNALFSKLQHATAVEIGVDPVVTVASNATGGVTGKMISPQSIAVGTASTGLVGKESDLFRFTFRHSFIMLLMICILTFLQAYLFIWIIPDYEVVGDNVRSVMGKGWAGMTYLAGLSAFLVILGLIVKLTGSNKNKN